MRALARLRRDRRGVATTEFAIWTALFFSLALIAMDFGAYFIQRSHIDQSVAAGSLMAFNTRDNVNFSNLPSYVQSLANDQGLTVTTSCNGVSGGCTNLNRTCACLKANATYVTQTCGTTCTGTGMTSGSVSGYYLTIRASRRFRAMVVPRGMLNNAAISQTATVRLQ